METEAENTLSRDVRSAPDKHLETMLVADHLYLQKFQNDKEAIDLLLTLAHIVRERKVKDNKPANCILCAPIS